MPLVFVLIYILLSWIVALMGQKRKFGFWGYYFCSLLFTPLLGMLFVLASDNPPQEQAPPNS